MLASYDSNLPDGQQLVDAFSGNRELVRAWEAVVGSNFSTDRNVLEEIVAQINLNPDKLDDFKLKFSAGNNSVKEQLINELEWFFGFKQGYFKESITTIPKGSRPDPPSQYLTVDFINFHRNLFNTEGAAFIAVKSWTEGGNPIYISLPPRKFVGLRSEMDKIIDLYRSKGNDWSVLRDELNLGSSTDLSGEEIYYIRITPGDARFSYEVPTGNEGGGN